MKKNLPALAGLILTLGFLALAVLAPVAAPYDPTEQKIARALEKPSREHWLGLDDVGRDQLSRIIHGARISLLIAVGSVALGAAGGVLIGALSGYYGGWLDSLLMRMIDVILTLPTIVLAIAVVSVLRSGVISVILAVGVTSIPIYARLTRGVVLSLKTLDYVQAAQAVGGSDGRIILRHVLPNALSPLVVQATLGAGTAVLVAAALSFLGLGVQPPTPEWGAMLSRGRTYIASAPHLIAFPGLAIALLVLGFNLLGDGLRDFLDPRLKHLTRSTAGGKSFA